MLARVRTVASLVVVVVAGVGPSSAAASSGSPGPGWEITARNYPTNLPPGGSGAIEIDVFNVGAAPSSGPITVTDTLPQGVTATNAGGLELPFHENGEPIIGHQFWNCTGTTVVTCTNKPSLFSFAGGAGGPNFANEEMKNLQPEIGIAVQAPGVPPGVEDLELTNHVTIAGGGALASASTMDPIKVSATPAGFGFTGWDGWFSNADGTVDTHAGSHPYEATFSFDLATVQERRPEPAGGQIRNIEVDLPPGFVGNPNAVPQCTAEELNSLQCPDASMVGILSLSVFGGTGQIRERLYNMVPPPGVAAEFAFTSAGLKVNTYLDSTVRSGSDYGITTHINNSAQRRIVRVVTTLWGVPGDPSHIPWRSGELGGCSKEQSEHSQEDDCGSVGPIAAQTPFLTLPTACGEAQPFTIRANNWRNENAKAELTFKSHDSNGNPTGFTGCDDLAFGPRITTAPDTASADTPTGLTVEVKPPVGGLETLEGLSAADIQNTTVTLPEGLVINPGQAAGLQACSEARSSLGTENAPECPNASKVGTVTIKSPLIEGAAEKQFEGDVYVLESNPPEVKLLVAASADGVNLKLVGVVHLNEQTGQLTTTFEGTPELPFTVFKLSFSGGAQAALDTPTQCGTYTTTSDFTPWSNAPGSTQNFLADAFPTASFGITAGPGGGACPSSPLPFAPSLVAGSTTDHAGAFTSFSLLLQRGDGQQRIEKLQFKEPAGLAGLISSVPLCHEANANAGTCPQASRIGHAVVASGPGPYPLVLPQPGAPELPIYLTGPYKGAPFGLSIVTPVVAGPFNLGTVITRAKIEVDPHTAQITITTDPLPQIVDGIPTDLRLINSIIDRPNFLFNPTNCTPAEFTGTAWGTPPPGAGGPGATAPLSSHFGVGSCRELEFHPKVAVSTGAKASKVNGASLNFDISYPKGALGRESWFNEAKFGVPTQLPARLTTLQKACLVRVFEANPAACPLASVIGHAIVHTPVLPVPLQGPVYFVSYGGAAFPNVVLLLQGYGVTVDLVGETLIKKGVTSATFRNTPDVPFENIEVSIPTGRYSEFGANLPHESYDFCGRKLVVPTFFKAQNGLEIHQNTPVGVTGCPKALTARQKLAAALKACHKKHNKGRRQACERAARKQYARKATKTATKS